MKEKDFIKKVYEENLTDRDIIERRALSARYAPKKKRFSLAKALAFSLIAVVITAVVLGALATDYNLPNKIANAKVMKTHAEIINTIKGFNKEMNRTEFSLGDFFGSFIPRSKSVMEDAAVPNGSGSGDSWNSAPSPSPTAPSLDFDEEQASEADTSQTNVQTEGIDEGDIVKWDSEYIYKLNSRGIFIVRANNGDLSAVSTIEIDNYLPFELYISGNKLVSIGGIYTSVSMKGGYGEPLCDIYCYYYYQYTDIRVYDITERDNPVLDRQFTFDGNFTTSRLVLEDNKLMFMVNYNFYYNGNETQYIPRMSDSKKNNGEFEWIPADNIYVYTDIPSYYYLILGEIDLDAPEGVTNIAAYLGLSGEIYVSADNIYVSTYDPYSYYGVNAFGWMQKMDNATEGTRIVKLGLDDLQQKATGRVNGSIKDRYSMDEYNGYLRVATTVSYYSLYNNLYVLDSELNVTGKIENIAQGERIYSARFNKDKGSIVTFRQMDPYFFFDLSDPSNPKITSEIKEDGVSNYIHYIGDTGYTIGIGKDTKTDGTSVSWLGIKVSLYYNDGTDAENVNTWVIPGDFNSNGNSYCYSEIADGYNPKALLYDEATGIIAFPYECYTYNYYGYNYYSRVEQGLAFFRFDVNAEKDEDKLVYCGTLTNLKNAQSTDEYMNYYDLFIARGLRIGEYIYTVSEKVITSYRLDTLAKVDSLEMYN